MGSTIMGYMGTTVRMLGMKEWILIVIPIQPIKVVTMFFSFPSFPSN